METKICSGCKLEKNVIDFYIDSTRKDGFRSRCKICCKSECSKYQKKNPENSRKKTKKFRDNNPDKVKEIYRKWRDNNLLRERERSNSWKVSNRDKINEYRIERRKKDNIYKITENLRNRVRNFFSVRNIRKSNRTFEIVGCSPQFLKDYIESKFTENMSWDKMGSEIHIDHIIPLSSAKTEEEVYKLCHYTNLQPLWAHENMSKGNKII